MGDKGTHATVGLRRDEIDKIDSFRKKQPYKLSRADVIYRALDLLWEQEGDPKRK